MCDKHGNTGAVSGGIKDLFGDIPIGIEVHPGTIEQTRLAGDHVITIDRRRNSKGLEGIEGLSIR